ncbi:hypothetical protein LTS18_006620, partial [Coniosporium uncinatum]
MTDNQFEKSPSRASKASTKSLHDLPSSDPRTNDAFPASTARRTHTSRLQRSYQDHGQSNPLAPFSTGQKNQVNRKNDEQDAHVEQGYYLISPWMDPQQDPKDHLFSLGQPFPHQLRPSMILQRRLQNMFNDEEKAGKFREQLRGRYPGADDDRYRLHRVASEAAREHRDPLLRVKSDQDVEFVSGRLQSDEVGDIGPSRTLQHPPAVDEHAASLRNLEEDSAGGKKGEGDEEEFETQADIDKKMREREQRDWDMLRNRWARLRDRHPEFLAEFLATCIAVFIGLAGGLINKLSYDNSSPGAAALTWGFAITVGVYASGGISGGHLNPVVSVVLAVFRGFSWRLCVQYILGQMLGSFVAGVIAIAVYGDAINHFDPTRSAAGISASALFTAPP